MLDAGLDTVEFEVELWSEEGRDIATGVLRPESILAKVRKMREEPDLRHGASWPYLQPSQVKRIGDCNVSIPPTSL